ncbi:MAG: RNA polymerase sigma factor [Planctomycetes bacterium]|nr:RNA polymerase sigma factor [Planctomycetota bacterium]
MDDSALAPLMSRLARGDAAAMQELFDLTREPLSRFFVRLCRRQDLCEDLLQNTYLRLWRYRGQYRGTGAVKSYVYRVAMNEWYTSMTQRGRRDRLRDRLEREAREAAAPSPSQLVQDDEARLIIMTAIEGLPARQREVFILHRLEGLSCREIAEILRRSPKTIESRLRLALEKLTEKLAVRKGQP